MCKSELVCIFFNISSGSKRGGVHPAFSIFQFFFARFAAIIFKGELSDSFTNYNNVGNTKVSVSIKNTCANKCTLSEIFLTEILKSFSGF